MNKFGRLNMKSCYILSPNEVVSNVTPTFLLHYHITNPVNEEQIIFLVTKLRLLLQNHCTQILLVILTHQVGSKQSRLGLNQKPIQVFVKT